MFADDVARSGRFRVDHFLDGDGTDRLLEGGEEQSSMSPRAETTRVVSAAMETTEANVDIITVESFERFTRG